MFLQTKFVCKARWVLMPRAVVFGCWASRLGSLLHCFNNIRIITCITHYYNYYLQVLSLHALKYIETTLPPPTNKKPKLPNTRITGNTLWTCYSFTCVRILYPCLQKQNNSWNSLPEQNVGRQLRKQTLQKVFV